MRIGTLTLHLPKNYGNALQMLALHKYLLAQGYETEVLSHWYSPGRLEISHESALISRFPLGFLRFCFECCTWTGHFCALLREKKIRKWLGDNIRWSEPQGASGVFPFEKLSDDVIIVGSDQIWNPQHKTSEFFLLGSVPDGVRKISYAASMGSDVFAKEKHEVFASCLRRFSAISVRESSARVILKSEFNINSELVCDPTLLLSQSDWRRILNVRVSKMHGRYNVAYLVSSDATSKWEELLRIAKETSMPLQVFTFSCATYPLYGWRFPFSALKAMLIRMRLFMAGVRLRFAADPSEFVSAIANSNGVFTDSFHGLMFATIFERKCNVVIGEQKDRIQMSARLRDFTSDFGRPEILTPRLSPKRLLQVSVTPKLAAKIEESKVWLKTVLEGSGCAR